MLTHEHDWVRSIFSAQKYVRFHRFLFQSTNYVRLICVSEQLDWVSKGIICPQLSSYYNNDYIYVYNLCMTATELCDSPTKLPTNICRHSTHTQVRAGVFNLFISTRRSNEFVNAMYKRKENIYANRIENAEETKQLNKRTNATELSKYSMNCWKAEKSNIHATLFTIIEHLWITANVCRWHSLCAQRERDVLKRYTNTCFPSK